MIPFLSSFFCICKPLDLIRSLIHSISSLVVDILSSNLTSVTLPPTTFEEDRDGGQEQEEEERRKKTAAAKETESTSTGTLTNIPFCIVGEEEERNAIDDENRERREISR